MKTRTKKWSPDKLIKDLVTLSDGTVTEAVKATIRYTRLDPGDLGREYSKRFPNYKFTSWTIRTTPRGKKKVSLNFNAKL